MQTSYLGPEVSLNRKKLKFRVCKNVSEQRKEIITLVNTSSVDTTYQWLMPPAGQGYFQVRIAQCKKSVIEQIGTTFNSITLIKLIYNCRFQLEIVVLLEHLNQ